MIDHNDVDNLPLFKSLNAKTRAAIAQSAFQRDLPAGHSLVIEGMPAEFGYFILRGHVRVLRMSMDGRVQVMARLSEGSPLNFISLLVDDRHNRASIETLTPVRLLTLDAAAFDRLLTTYPDFSALLLRSFAQRISHMSDLAANLSLYTVRARLAQFLMSLADQPPIAGGWTQDEIAAQIGTVRDVVGRLLREFEAEGLITRHRQKITLLDRGKLEITANGQDA